LSATTEFAVEKVNAGKVNKWVSKQFCYVSIDDLSVLGLEFINLIPVTLRAVTLPPVCPAYLGIHRRSEYFVRATGIHDTSLSSTVHVAQTNADA